MLRLPVMAREGSGRVSKSRASLRCCVCRHRRGITAAWAGPGSYIASGQVIDHHVADHCAVAAAQRRIPEVAAEQGTEGVTVSEPQDAERTDHHVHANGIRLAAENLSASPWSRISVISSIAGGITLTMSADRLICS